MSAFTREEGILIIDRLIDVIGKNKQYLSDIDGAIGDGDHGINMNKGFNLCRESLDQNPGDMIHGFNTLSRILIMKIGGSMGPLYGKMFKSFALALEGKDIIDAPAFGLALVAMKDAVSSISQAKPGDKTLVDALFPAVDAYQYSLGQGDELTQCLKDMKTAAETGRDATEAMVARIGRSSRLGERSRGVIDAGAASCAIILGSMADTIIELISP